MPTKSVGTMSRPRTRSQAKANPAPKKKRAPPKRKSRGAQTKASGKSRGTQTSKGRARKDCGRLSLLVIERKKVQSHARALTKVITKLRRRRDCKDK